MTVVLVLACYLIVVPLIVLVALLFGNEWLGARMALETASCFFVTGVCLLILSRRQ